uniref:Mitochondrial import inner membrane translocase subunit Tim10 B n=1 Tax=Sinocyclocheilus rhinocerous TaxID=307959 RepID=A0A673K3J3_9TELE
MDPAGQLRNLRDFLLVYNRMTEICFQRCTSNFNYRNLTMDEERCVDSCAGKLIRTNHHLMGTYVQLMPAMVQKRMQEMESKAAAQGGASSLENPSTAITATTPILESPHIPSVSNNPSDIKTNVSAFEQTQSLTDVPTVPNNSQTFTNESLEGLVPSSVTTTSIPETRSEGGAGQSPQNPS